MHIPGLTLQRSHICNKTVTEIPRSTRATFQPLNEPFYILQNDNIQPTMIENFGCVHRKASKFAKSPIKAFIGP